MLRAPRVCRYGISLAETRLFRAFGFVRSVFGSAAIRALRSNSQLLYFGSNRTKRTESVLRRRKPVRIRAIWRIDRFLKLYGIIPV